MNRRIRLPAGSPLPRYDFLRTSDRRAALRRREPLPRLRAGATSRPPKTCGSVQTLVAVLSISGRAYRQRLRAKIDAGFEAPARVRLELPAPGKPFFTYVVDGETATLVLPRDGRVLREAPPADTLEALTGVAIGPDDLRTIVAGCGLTAGDADTRAQLRRRAGSRSIPIARRRGCSRLRGSGSWRPRRVESAQSVGGPLEVRYADFVAGRPATIRLRMLADRAWRRARSEYRPDDSASRRSRSTSRSTPAAFSVEVPPTATPMTLEAASESGPAWPLSALAFKRLAVRARAHAKVNLDLRVLGTQAGRLSRAAHGLSVDRAARHARRASTRPGPFALKCRTSGVPLDDVEPRLEGGGGAVDGASAGAGAPRDIVISIRKEIPMQAGLGGGSADAAAALLALARLWGGVPLPLLRDVAGGIGADVAVLPVRRHGPRPRTGRGDLPAGRSPDALGGRRPAAIRRFDCRGVFLVRRRSGCRPARAARAADAAGAVADPRGADDQRSRAAGRAPPSRDRAPSRPHCARPARSRRRCLAAGRRFSACFGAERPPPGRSSRCAGRAPVLA